VWTQAEEIGSVAKRWLGETGGCGTVHSVFSAAVHVLFPGPRFLTVTNYRAGLLTTGIAVRCVGEGGFLGMGVCPGSHTELRGESLIVANGGLGIKLSGAVEWIPPAPPRGPAINSVTLLRRLDQLKRELRIWERGRPLSCLPGIASSDLQALFVKAFMQEKEEQLRRVTQRLLGWGPGLTPSGDDFLAGFMLSVQWGEGATRNSFRARTTKICSLILTQAVHRTTVFGRELLRLASLSQGPYAALALLQALYDPSGEDALASATSLLSLGATSGADLLAGIIAGAEVILSKESNGVE
jgi:hypothetical protein